jgi:hypothetical protein
MQLHLEFAALIQALEDEKLEYAVAGGLALAIWGAPRATTDIDLLVRRADLGHALIIAKRLGFTIIANPMKFSDGTEMCRATKFEAGEQLTLDLLLTDEDSPDWQTRERHQLGAASVTVVSRDTLIQMKARAPRPQDIADIARLKDIDR